MEVLYLVMGAFLVISILQLVAIIVLASFMGRFVEDLKKVSISIASIELIMEDITEEEEEEDASPSPRQEVDEGGLVDLDSDLRPTYDPRFYAKEM